MSLWRDTLLFGTALIVYGIWVELDGFSGALFAYTGIALAAVGVLGSIAVAMGAGSTTGETNETEDQQ